jgi:minor extracellular serine protease Vpr
LFSSRVGGPAGRRRTFRRSAWATVSVIAVAALCVVSAAGAANNPKSPRDVVDGSFTPALVPPGLSQQPATVVVQLAGDPVTVADAKSATKFDKSQWDGKRAELRSQQAPVEDQIRSLGGRVLASYQLAYNGIKVSIPAGKAAALGSIAGVTSVRPLQVSYPDNTRGVPLIGGPQVWDGLTGLHGEGMKIGIIDTGIDYTHADFGGPGDPLAYDSAFATDKLPANPALFGPLAAKVKGGIDLVGDAYDAGGTAAQQTPNPDLNPLDCNEHGTHVAGTAAGFGVRSDGSTYTGPYNATTISSPSNTWNVGPGVAPKADLYAIRVFGCDGSTNVVVDAIEWAVANDMDVINMSLGSPFGSADSPDAVAATNAARDGVIVIASAGNSGPNAYMSGAPAAAEGALSVAASDPMETFSGASLTMSSGTVGLSQSNNATWASGLSGGIFVVQPNPTNPDDGSSDVGPVGLGCSPDDYTGASGKIVITMRGNCARVDRAVLGENADAAAVVLLNNGPGYPPIEGDIPNPATGVAVAIPFFGALVSDTAKFTSATGSGTLMHNSSVANPLYKAIAGFSSGGPRTGDSGLKPNVTAPGVSIVSAGMGTGTGAFTLSGTSMAAPHTTGMAALVKQAHPTWRKVKYWQAAIANTSDPGMVSDYSTRLGGTGLIQALPATRTQVVALGSGSDDNHEEGHGGNAQAPSLNFGYAETNRDYSQRQVIQLRNFSNASVTFSVADALDQGLDHSVSFDQSTVTVGPRGTRDVSVRLTVPLASFGGGSGASLPGFEPFTDAAGLVTFTPVGGSNNGVTLRVPYYLVPQAVSNVQTRADVSRLARTGAGTATTTNRGGAIGSFADWYAWGISDKRDRGVGSNDIRAVGVQSFAPASNTMVFAISTYHRWSNAAMNEFDVLIDTTGDGVEDFVVLGFDIGAITTGSFDGRMGSYTINLTTGATVGGSFVAGSPTDSSTIELVTRPTRLGLSPAHPRFTYWVQSFGLTDETSDLTEMKASFNAFAPAVNNGMFDVLGSNGSATEALTLNAAEQAITPALGWMVISQENPSVAGDGGGTTEAQLIGLKGDNGGGNH